MEQTALILIDIQNDYFPGGKMILEEPEQAAQTAAQLLDLFRQKQKTIVHIQHESLTPAIPFLLPETEGQKIHASVRPLPHEQVFTKHYPSAFWQTALETWLSSLGVKKLIIAGMMTHMCISATARAAMERGFEVTIVQDGCATLALELDGVEIPAETVHRTALAELTLIAQIKSLDTINWS